MSASIPSGSVDTNSHMSLPSSTISVTNPVSKTDEFNLLTCNTNNQQSLLRLLIRRVMRTFYDPPKSLVVEYICHHECINLKDLADHLHLTEQTVQTYIQQLKCDKYIIEERRSNELYYKIDIARFVNVVKYRLIRMQCTIEDFEREQICKQITYKCQQCLREYTARDLEKLHQYSSAGDLMCSVCYGIVNENNPAEEKRIIDGEIIDMKLFNEQMTPLFEILERIDEIMKNEGLTTISRDTEKDNDDYLPDMEIDNADATVIRSSDEIIEKPFQAKNIPYESKPLPEWFLH